MSGLRFLDRNIAISVHGLDVGDLDGMGILILSWRHNQATFRRAFTGIENADGRNWKSHVVHTGEHHDGAQWWISTMMGSGYHFHRKRGHARVLLYEEIPPKRRWNNSTNTPVSQPAASASDQHAYAVPPTNTPVPPTPLLLCPPAPQCLRYSCATSKYEYANE